MKTACEVCGDGDEDLQLYRLPVHNGVYPSPTETTLCDPCAYLIAENLAEFAQDAVKKYEEQT